MKTRLMTVTLLLTLLLSACASARNKSALLPTVMVQAPAATEAPAFIEGVIQTGEKAEEYGLAATQVSSAAYPALAPVSGSSPQVGRMIIKDALIDLLVADTDVAINRITALAADQGGYLISTRAWLENGYKYAELRMGVPSSNFESTLNYLRQLGIKVLNEQASGQDVSAEYADLQSRLTNLEATAARVREFLNQAKTVEESLRINQTLSELEGQIEQVKGQMKFYEGRAAYSTITVTLKPQIPTPTPAPTPTPTPGWNPGNTAREATKVMTRLLQGLVDLTIWAIILLWPFILIAVIAIVVYRRWRQKKTPPQP